MFSPREHENSFLFYLRWAARLASVVCLAIILLFFLGEGFGAAQIGAREWLGFLFFPLGVFVGLVLAWKKEGLGGMINIFAVLGFYLIYGWLLSGSFWQGWALIPFLIPGILFVLYKKLSTARR